MSNTSSPSDSPLIQPLHNPAQAAVVQTPLGSSTNGVLHAPGQGFKATLLAKKLASKGGNPKYISPTDKMMTPCTAKISESKKRHFSRGKPVQLFMKDAPESTEVPPSVEAPQEEQNPQEGQKPQEQAKSYLMAVDDENPF